MQDMGFRNIVSIAVVILSCVSRSPADSEDVADILWPSRLTVRVGGMSVDEPQLHSACWRDATTGYYLCRWIECDGAHITITLTKDRRLIGPWNHAWAAGVQKRQFPLSTAHGITIGATKDEVRRKLGEPIRTAIRGEQGQYWCALYKAVDKKHELALRNTYIFKDNRLIEISIYLESPEGGDLTELDSDDGWPSSQF